MSIASTSILTALAVVLSSATGRAEQPARPMGAVADTARLERRALIDAPLRERDPLPRLVASLPRSTPVVVYVPAIDLALADAGAAVGLLRAIQPALAERSTSGVLAELLALDRGDDSDDRRARLTTPGGLATIGVDVSGGAALAPSASDDAVLLAFELSNRPRFEAWLAGLAGGATRRVEIGAERASVVETASAKVVTCLSRQSVAYCQLGESAGPDPVALLRAAVSFAPPTLAQVPGLGRAFQRLPEDAHAYLVVNAEPAARLAVQLAAARSQREHRFDPPEARRLAEQRNVQLTQRAKRLGELLEGGVVGLYPRTEQVSLRAELSVTDRGARALHELVGPADPAGTAITRWSRTPALARLVLRTRADEAERLLGLLGISAPPGSLSGTLALLCLGVDPESPLVKGDQESDLIGWAFLLPSAAAVGLRTSASADAVHEALSRTLQRSMAPRTVRRGARELEREVSDAGPRPARTTLAGQAFGSPFEVRVFDELVLAGAGPGAGAAALRRLGALPQLRGPEARRAEVSVTAFRRGDLDGRRRADDVEPIAEGAIHLRAIDAALETGSFPADARRELRVLESLRTHLRPVLDQFDAVSFEVRALEDERRVRVDLRVER